MPRPPMPSTPESLRAMLDDFADAEIADIDAMLDVGRGVASQSWAGDVLEAWLADRAPATSRVLDVATGVLSGFGIARRPEPARVTDAIVLRAADLGAVGLGHAANNVAFLAVRALRDAGRGTQVRSAAGRLLRDLLAHADAQSFQSVARKAAQEVLATHPPTG